MTTPQASPPAYDAAVAAAAADGTLVGRVTTFRTIAAALDAAPDVPTRPYRILVRAGRYHEKLVIAKPFVTLAGEGPERTTISFDAAADTKRADGTTYGTGGSATLTISAPSARLEDLTVENAFDYPANAAKTSNDPTKLVNAQAVALRTDRGSDRAVFVRVRLVGYQDTLYADAGRHYFADCEISGHVDFIFGAGQAAFERCNLISRDRASATNGYVTAASTDVAQPYGFVFLDSRLMKERPTMADASVALGRPWHPTRDLPDGSRAADPNAVAAVVFIRCWMDSHIAPRGWDAMTGRDKDGRTITFAPMGARFVEFGSTGPGAIADPARRVISAEEASRYTVASVLAGWDPRSAP